ncbi:peroxiredoxin family protein [Lunatimonas salinarum]|uniref:peroxiredoxin family protein n=1 Tax=Lunatimonas salinarum TaxID=1774590 RepID=UPI001ADEE0C1|nr:redoxin domain-containing protein [Lunatimonas salinarum]
MKKITKNALLAFVFLFLGVMGWAMIGKYKSLQTPKPVTVSLMDLPVKTVDGTWLDLSKFAGQVPIVLIYFNSSCDLCKHEIAQINQHLEAFEPALLLFISSEDPNEIDAFKNSFDWESNVPTYFLVDEDASIAKTLEVFNVPVSLIFSKDMHLVWRFEGPAKVSSLLNNLPKSL